MTTLQTNRLLDCAGLACPLPVVRTKKTIDEMNAGEVVEVRATDKGSVADLQSWAGRTGHQYIGLKEEEGVFRHFIRKAEAADTKKEIRFPHTATNEELLTSLSSSSGEKPVILDVREPAEYVFGHIPGAISIPLGRLEAQLDALDPARAYYVVCRSGARSDVACQLLAEKGFTRVQNVIPGMSEWKMGLEQG